MAVALYVLNQQERGHRVDRVMRDRSNPLDFMRDDELIARYRLDRPAILDLCHDFNRYLERPTRRSQSLPVSLQILIALRYYATGTFLSMVGDGHTVGKMSVSRCIHKVTHALLQQVHRHITFPRTMEAQRRVMIDFYSIAGFPRVLGAVDGSLVPIKGPSIDEHVYVCHKGYHALNVQAISDSNLKFVHFVARWPGSTHDAFVWANCQVSSDFEEGRLPQNVWVLGDSGYPLKPWMMTPFLNPSTGAQRRYNKAHKKTRCVIERTFGVWKSRFRCLDKSGGNMMFSPERCCRDIIATAILHNICITRRIPLPEDQVELDDEDENEVYNGPIERGGLQGRAHLVQSYFGD